MTSTITKLRLLLVLLLAPIGVFAVSQNSLKLTLEDCYKKARENYPLLQQMELIKKTSDFSLSNASKGYLPQINIYGQASYQSAVTELPISLPNTTIPKVSKDQYKLYGEVVEPLTDLLQVHRQQELIKANQAVEEQRTETEIFKLKDRINQLYFGILILNAQLAQVHLLHEDIQHALDKVNIAIANKTALATNADMLSAELLKVQQQRINLIATRAGFEQMLSVFIGEKISESTMFETPQAQLEQREMNRPELRLYDLQRKVFDAQNELITQKLLPHFFLFFQGGYGWPALNFLSNDFDPYYLTGLRLNWNLSAFYTSKNERKVLKLGQRSLDVQQEVFLFNSNIALSQQDQEIDKYKQLLASDDKIVVLRRMVKATAEKQLEYGAISAIDYLSYLNALDQAQQNQALHRMQLLLAQYNYQNTSGN